MSSSTESLNGRARTLTLWAGYGIVVFSALHLVYFGVVTFNHWPGWFTGELRDPASTGVEADASLAGFWAVPGGFALPMIALGLMIIGYAREHRPVPGYVALLLVVWIVVGSFILVFTGFVLGIIPALMLVAARFVADSSSRTNGKQSAHGRL